MSACATVSGTVNCKDERCTYLQTSDGDRVVIAGHHLLEVQIALNLLHDALLGLLFGARRVAQCAQY
jgi:hypothetical protein